MSELAPVAGTPSDSAERGEPGGRETNMRYQVAEGVLSQEFSGEGILLSLASAEYFSLNGVGLVIWRLLRDGADDQTIKETLQREYDAPPEQVCRDLETFLNRMLELKLIIPDVS